MAAPVIAGAIGAGLNIAGGLLGRWLSSGDREKQKELEEEAMRLYGDMSPPTLERVVAEKISTGEWEMPADFGNKDPRDAAIRRLMERGLSGGMDEQSRLAQEEGRLAAAAQEARGRASVRQEAERRGLGGAAEVYGQLGAQQAGAQTAALASQRAAADAEARALEALRTGGTMAGQAEAQDFARAATTAQARDAIARYNAEMAMEAQRFNTGLTQQEWGNSLQLADRRYGATTRRAGGYGQAAADTQRMWGGIGQGAGYGAAAYGQFGGTGGGGGGGAAPAGSFNPTQGNTGAIGSDAALEYWRKQGGR